MFFIATLRQNIFIAAKYFRKGLRKDLISNLINNVEGYNAGPFGSIIMVIEICNKFGDGKLLVGTPSAMYNLTYKAITFRAFKGEVFDAIITNLTNVGFFSEAGLLQIFISKNQMPFGLVYSENKKIFIDPMKPKEKLGKDTVIRIRIISSKNEKNPNHVLGTINGQCLGLLTKMY